MLDVNAHPICVNCNNDVASICLYKILSKLVHKTLCYMLEVIAKVDDVGLCLCMLVRFYQSVLELIK